MKSSPTTANVAARARMVNTTKRSARSAPIARHPNRARAGPAQRAQPEGALCPTRAVTLSRADNLSARLSSDLGVTARDPRRAGTGSPQRLLTIASRMIDRDQVLHV